MTKFSLTGIFSCLAGCILVGFEALSVLMGTEGGWKSLKLTTVIDPKHFAWIDEASFFGLERVPEYIVNMPLFMLFFCIGILFFVLDYFFGRK